MFVLGIAASLLIGSINHTAPMFAGHSITRISSGSMINSGFEIGDIAIVQKTNTKSLKKGDIIAYYRFGLRSIESMRDAKDYEEYDKHTSWPGFNLSTIFGVPTKELKNAGSVNATIVFHEIINIKVDDGKIWYQTKGSSNGTADTYYVSQDYVLGKYVNASGLTSVLNVIYNLNLTAVLIAIPIIWICGVLIYNIMQNLHRAVLEFDILSKRRKLDDSVCVRNNVGYGMSNKTKYKVLAMATPEQRLYYIPLLWKNADTPDNIRKYHLRKKLYFNKYEKIDEIKKKCNEMVRQGHDEDLIMKYYKKEMAKAHKELEIYEKEIKERNKRLKSIYKEAPKDKKKK